MIASGRTLQQEGLQSDSSDMKVQMDIIEYVNFCKVNPAALVPLLNKQKIRAHLIDHPLFDEGKAKAWIEMKLKVDASTGCKVRAILIDKTLSGWCGIQLENGRYEMAMVIDDRYWGLGRKIFRELVAWARELGHETVFIHFLHTRPVYRFLTERAKAVYESEMLGNRFTTYELAVEQGAAGQSEPVCCR